MYIKDSMEIVSKDIHSQRLSLYTGGIAAIFASTCCLGPFLLVTAGLSSATTLYFITAAEWSRPFFIMVALIALIISYRYIWSSAPVNYSVKECSNQRKVLPYKIFFAFVSMLIILALMLPYIATDDVHNV